jgi:hypothetical protein
VYRAEVTFPAAGTYRYTVDDGFGNAFPHEFPPVTIGGDTAAPAVAAEDGGLPWWPFAIVAAGLLGMGGVLLGRRRRGAQPLPA